VNAHQVGDRIKIRWPGGPHDFVIEYYDDQGFSCAPMPGFQWMRGVVVEPGGLAWRSLRRFQVRPTGNGEYELLPKIG
jgi:hypothetical protein